MSDNSVPQPNAMRGLMPKQIETTLNDPAVHLILKTERMLTTDANDSYFHGIEVGRHKQTQDTVFAHLIKKADIKMGNGESCPYRSIQLQSLQDHKKSSTRLLVQADDIEFREPFADMLKVIGERKDVLQVNLQTAVAALATWIFVRQEGDDGGLVSQELSEEYVLGKVEFDEDMLICMKMYLCLLQIREMRK